MIAILLAASRIAAGGLQVSARVEANPYVLVRRRYRELRNTRELRFVRYAAIIRQEIDKTVAFPNTPDTGCRVGHVDQSGCFDGCSRFRFIVVVLCRHS